MLTEERMSTFPEEVLEHVLAFLTSHKDRNSVSLVCKAWYMIEALSRQHVFIGNCYAISPMSLTYRFKNLKSLTIKGKPRFSDFGLVPPGWGAHVHPWIVALANSYPWLEELRLKRMVVSDDALALLASSFLNFQVLVLTSCDGFTTDGLIPIAATCRHLAELELQECIITDTGGQWLSYFPESCTSLVSLNFSCTSSEVNFTALEKLVTRCTSLKSLKVNHAVSLKQLGHLLLKAPQLIDLGTGSLSIEKGAVDILRFKSAVANCKGLQSLSGFWEVSPLCLPFLYPICGNLTSLNLSYACTLQSSDMIRLISHCYHLKRLWVLDCVEDTGLQATAATCKALEELRVFPGMGQRSVTEEGLVSVSKGCPQMTSILYFCGQMTSSALECVANNLPQLICFRLCILDPYKPDHLTKGPFDEGFGAVVKNCKNLKRFSLSGLLTDKAFEYIGSYGKELEMLSLAFAGESDFGMQLILKGCQKLRILEIRDSPFGDAALLYGWQKYLSMRSLWMSSCKVTVAGCHLLARNMPCLNVEIIKEDPTDPYAEKLYVYRTVAGPRTDAADFVWTC